MSGPTPSGIFLTVPEADGVVEQRRTPAADRWWRRMPAHITLLFPFVPDPDEGVLEELRFFFAHVDGFDLSFSEIGEFPGVVYLAPEPADELRSLTEALVRRWPSCRPYDGQFDEITPHLTVAKTDDPDRLREVRAGAEAALPLRAQAVEASLWLRESEGWRRLADFPLAEVD